MDKIIFNNDGSGNETGHGLDLGYSRDRGICDNYNYGFGDGVVSESGYGFGFGDGDGSGDGSGIDSLGIDM